MLRRSVLIAAPAIVLASSLKWMPGSGHDPARWNAPRVDGDLNVRLRKGALNNGDFAAIMRRHHARIVKTIPLVPRLVHVRTPLHDGKALAHELEAAGLVEWADPTLVSSLASLPTSAPNDPDYIGQNSPAYTTINAPQVWFRYKLTSYGSMPPCIDIDTGIQGTFSGSTFTSTHPDLSNGQVLPGWSVGAANANVSDNVGSHGTSCAAILAATTNDSVGTSSVGWGGTVTPILATGSDTNIVSGIDWVVANIAAPGFINHPYVLGAYSASLDAALQAAYTAGFMNFGATGDAGGSTCRPGPCDTPSPMMIGVTAVDGLGSTPLSRGGVTIASAYASYGGPFQAGGAGATIAAPGGSGTTNLKVATVGSTWAITSFGTSYSAPIVCAIARFLKTIQPGLTQQDIFNIITDPANGQATTNFTSQTSMKCIDFLACVNAAFAFNPITMN